MKLASIVKRVQSKLSDPEGLYVDDDYVLGFCQDEYEALYNKLRLTGYQFDVTRVVLPNVAAGLPNLDSFQDEGGTLYQLVQPTIIEYKLPGTPDSLYNRADGPLDFPRDVDPSTNYLDSWAFQEESILLSAFNTNLDLRVWGEFTLDPLVALDSQVQTPRQCAVVLVAMISAACARERGNAAWVLSYSALADERFDDMAIQLTKSDQGKTRRVGRINRPNQTGGFPVTFQQP